jgi:hypothetical protein
MPPMSPDKHADDAPGHVDAVAHHQTDDHGGDHGHDDHAHGTADELGPIDVAAWGAGIAGIAIAVVIAACFVLATSGLA